MSIAIISVSCDVQTSQALTTISGSMSSGAVSADTSTAQTDQTYSRDVARRMMEVRPAFCSTISHGIQHTLASTAEEGTG